ncbi:NAD(P)-dependent oxidoreductase [Tomitella biformata]|uniref:NAD(P)-dependent oxidoreductase n=1 Tax=Tomitella biformata TaxID=630403 RepID=UPI000466AF8F|nr:NAD(P)-dependent oxidoreductase [Tomitella biformata]
MASRTENDAPLRVLLHFDASEALAQRLAPRWAGLDVRLCAENDEARFAALLPETDVLWHVLRPITARDMSQASNLKLIQKLGSGVNTIDLEHARTNGIAVSNMVGANAPAVAESALALILATLRRTVALDRATRAGRGWPIDTSLAESVGEIRGKTVGLLGHGVIAQVLERPLVALGARVLHHTRSGDASNPDWRPLDELLGESDIGSLHLPLTDGTTNLLDARRLALLRPGAIVVNTARGGIIDEHALAAALVAGRLGGAGLDTFEDEPIGTDNPLLDLDSVVLSPHVAWLTAETMERCVDLAAANCHRLAAGAPLANLII